jgi:hypothetical protein
MSIRDTKSEGEFGEIMDKKIVEVDKAMEALVLALDVVAEVTINFYDHDGTILGGSERRFSPKTVN